LLSGTYANAVEETLVFAWDPHPEIERVINFEMYWSDTSGGPYGQLAVIPKEAAIDNEEPVTAVVTGLAETHVTRYFVLRACGNVTQEDSSILYECSDDSNEVSYDFWVPFGGFEVPINFRIIAQ
jgi:hypothetical protein